MIPWIHLQRGAGNSLQAWRPAIQTRSYDKTAWRKVVAAKLARSAGPPPNRALEALRTSATKTAPEAPVWTRLELNLARQADGKGLQTVSGDVVLPRAPARNAKERILFLSESAEQQAAALKLGATVAGGKELVPQLADGALECDRILCTREMFPRLIQIARVLGPRGLMPSPAKGSVGDNVGDLFAGAQARVPFQSSAEAATIAVQIGQLDWPDADLLANARAVSTAALAAARRTTGAKTRTDAELLGAVAFVAVRPGRSEDPAAARPWRLAAIAPAAFVEEPAKERQTFVQMLSA